MFDFVLHLDAHLQTLAQEHGALVYLILFVIIFCETGLVIAPILPGDTLLFIGGAVAAMGNMRPALLIPTLIIAAVGGDNLNYAIGRWLGPRAFHENSRWFNRNHLERAHAFYEKHGGKTLILARFVPIVRTYAPFVAGLGAMRYLRFLAFSVAGGTLWVGSLIGAGYFFGNLSWVKNNLTVVILGIVALSLVPTVIAVIRHNDVNLNK